MCASTLLCFILQDISDQPSKGVDEGFKDRYVHIWPEQTHTLVQLVTFRCFDRGCMVSSFDIAHCLLVSIDCMFGQAAIIIATGTMSLVNAFAVTSTCCDPHWAFQ